MFLSSRQQCNSINSESAAVSLLRFSRSSMKFNSADRLLSFCCRFLGAFSPMTRLSVAVVLDGDCWICSRFPETVDSVSCVAFCMLMLSWSVSVIVPSAVWFPYQKPWKIRPQDVCRCILLSFVGECRSFLFLFCRPHLVFLGEGFLYRGFSATGKACGRV